MLIREIWQIVEMKLYEWLKLDVSQRSTVIR